MRASTRALGLTIGICLFCPSCADYDPNRKETFPAAGEVYVDGKPAANLAVTCRDVAGIDKQAPTVASAFTDDSGKFRLATYEQGDGVPEGEYVLTFLWGKMNLISMNYGGPDKLKGRYTTPAKSKCRFKVEKGKPVDLGRIDLSTK